MHMPTSRRIFCAQAASLFLPPRLLLSQTASATRPDVAAIAHDRILHAAALYLAQPPVPLTALPCPRSPDPPHDFYSESESEDHKPDDSNPPAFTAHRDALLNLSLYVPTLSAAFDISLLIGFSPSTGRPASKSTLVGT